MKNQEIYNRNQGSKWEPKVLSSCLSPCFTVFHEEAQTFSWTRYQTRCFSVPNSPTPGLRFDPTVDTLRHSLEALNTMCRAHIIYEEKRILKKHAEDLRATLARLYGDGTSLPMFDQVLTNT